MINRLQAAESGAAGGPLSRQHPWCAEGTQMPQASAEVRVSPLRWLTPPIAYLRNAVYICMVVLDPQMRSHSELAMG